MADTKIASSAWTAPHGGPVQLFYQGKDAIRRPIVARADGIYMWDTDGRRYIDASSGPVVSNIGHGNSRVLAAMIEQAQKVAFASRTVFENEPNAKLADLITGLAGPGLERAYFVSGGSEATETAIKMARQYAVAKGEARRWKVIGRDPGYHGATLGAASVTGDPQAEKIFAPLMPVMPKVPAPFTYRLPPNHDADSYARACASALEDTIRHEGAETVLAFIMEPVGGLATGALVAPDHYYRSVREICDRHGVLLIYDEVMSGAGRTGKERKNKEDGEFQTHRCEPRLRPHTAANHGAFLCVQDRNLGRKFALRTVSRANPHALPLHKLTDPVTPQRFHVDEDVRCVSSARHEAVALAAVEPLHRGVEGRALGLRGKARGALDGCRRGRCRAVVERDQPSRLKTARSLDRFAHDAGALIGGFEARLSNAGLMQENISLQTTRGFDETVPLGQVEPLHLTGDFLSGFPCNR